MLRIPPGLDLASAAPLLCAGITTYSPLVYYGAMAKGTDAKVREERENSSLTTYISKSTLSSR